MSSGLRPDTLHALFPTFVAESYFPGHGEAKQGLMQAVHRIWEQDVAGQQQSDSEYHVGYTSYFSRNDLYEAPEFRELNDFIGEKAGKYAQTLKWDLERYRLRMSAMWININPMYSYHPEHVHPLTHISGVFYVSCASDSGDLILKDPRQVRAMTPVPVLQANRDNTDVVKMNPAEGKLVLFPAWLTHAVAQNLTEHDRVSLSFNFEMQRG